MNALVQTYAAFAIVAAAAAWLVVRSIRKRGKPGCGGGCGCSAEDLRSKALRELGRSQR